jgi:hypothetical protein
MLRYPRSKLAAGRSSLARRLGFGARSPWIFICYRREDSADQAHRLRRSLDTALGRRAAFIDMDTPLGENVRDYITGRISSVRVVLVVIGPKWASSLDERGQRSEQEVDYVRLEIRTALEQKVPLIPVLVAGAPHPAAQALPAELRTLAERNAASLGSGALWDADVERLIKTIKDLRREPREPGSRRMSRTVVAGFVLAAAAAGVGWPWPAEQQHKRARQAGAEVKQPCPTAARDRPRGHYCLRFGAYDAATPDIDAPTVHFLKADELIEIRCQMMKAEGGLWDRLADGHYINDFLVKTPKPGTPSPDIPRC